MALSLESADLDPYLVMNGIGMPQMGTGLPAKFQANCDDRSGQAGFLRHQGAVRRQRQLTGTLTFDRKAPNIEGIRRNCA